MNQSIQNALGETLDYSFAEGAGTIRQSDWIVVLGHGVTGNKDRPVVADTAAALNSAGFDTLRFSFAGNGDSEGTFRDATISKEVGDLSAILDTVAATYPKITYIGHSMGGAVGVIQASKDRRINALISLAGMIDTKSFPHPHGSRLRPQLGARGISENVLGINRPLRYLSSQRSPHALQLRKYTLHCEAAVR